MSGPGATVQAATDEGDSSTAHAPAVQLQPLTAADITLPEHGGFPAFFVEAGEQRGSRTLIGA
jgi:hypothetical protein